MKYQGWTVYADTYLAEWGEYECTGAYTGTRVLWQGAHKYSDSNQVTLELHVGTGRSTASVQLKYYGYSHCLFMFKCQSIRHAVRKANFRLRGRLPALIRQAIDGVYKTRTEWRCAYRGDQPFCSYYYRSYEISNGEGIPCGEYTLVEHNGHGYRMEFRGTGYTGTGFRSDPKFPYWIDLPLERAS